MPARTRMVLGAVLASVIALATWWWFKHVQPVRDLKREVALHFVDPDSVVFELFERSASTGGACGLVNAKNRMGGYVGISDFVFTPDKRLLLRPEGRSDSQSLQRQLDATNELIAFLEVLIATCPEWEAQKKAQAVPRK